MAAPCWHANCLKLHDNGTFRVHSTEAGAEKRAGKERSFKMFLGIKTLSPLFDIGGVNPANQFCTPASPLKMPQQRPKKTDKKIAKNNRTVERRR